MYGNSFLCLSPAENRDLKEAETGDGNPGPEKIRGTCRKIKVSKEQ